MWLSNGHDLNCILETSTCVCVFMCVYHTDQQCVFVWGEASYCDCSPHINSLTSRYYLCQWNGLKVA